ncbi:DUF397 domain-containing protein [Streptomyces sp. NPDC059009]|uniref:DUF397 domain-containing protein n=1 Tax=Streptomyces sp. NPDC059009 TaxID=3346694 RepID=UPI00367FB10D
MTALPRHVRSSTALRGALWRRSSHSNGMNNCVETTQLTTGALTGQVAVRDSKDTAGPALLFTSAGWEEFVNSLG